LVRSHVSSGIARIVSEHAAVGATWLTLVAERNVDGSSWGSKDDAAPKRDEIVVPEASGAEWFVGAGKPVWFTAMEAVVG